MFQNEVLQVETEVVSLAKDKFGMQQKHHMVTKQT